MNDKQKRIAVIGGGAAVIGAYVLSRKKKGGSGGGGGSIFGSSGDGLSMPGDAGAGATEPSPASTISDILSGLPAVPTFTGGGGFSTPPVAAAMAGIPRTVTNGGGLTTKKESSGWGSILTGAAATTTTQAGVWSVMFPVQTLGRASATIADAALSYVAAPEDLAIIHKKQAENVIKYPRAASAVSMLTGGATAHAPVTKKQQEAREAYPNVYNAWKTLFSWAGA